MRKLSFFFTLSTLVPALLWPPHIRAELPAPAKLAPRPFPLATIMVISRDFIRWDELPSAICKIREMTQGLCLEVEGRMVRRTDGPTDDSLIGGNADFS